MPSLLDAQARYIPSMLDAPAAGVEAQMAQEGELLRGLRRGGLGAVASIQGAGGALLDPFAPQMARSAYDAAMANQAYSQQNLAPKFQSFDDVKSAGDFVDYGLGAFGEAVPSMATALAGGMVGRGLGAVSGGSRLANTIAGGAAGVFPMEAGEQALTMQGDPQALANTTPMERLGLSAGKGVIGSVLEAAPEAIGLNTLLSPVKRGMMGALGAVGRGTAQGAIAEGPLTEAPQEYVGQAFHTLANPDRDKSEDWANIKEAGIRGMFGGGPLGAVHGAARAGVTNFAEPMADLAEFASPYAQQGYGAAKEMAGEAWDATKEAAGQAKEAVQPEIDLAKEMKANIDQYGITEGMVRNEDLMSRHSQDRAAQGRMAGATANEKIAENVQKGNDLSDLLSQISERNSPDDIPGLLDTFRTLQAESEDFGRSKSAAEIRRLAAKQNRTGADDGLLHKELVSALRGEAFRNKMGGNLKTRLTGIIGDLLGDGPGAKASLLGASERDTIRRGVEESLRNSPLDETIYNALQEAGRNHPDEARLSSTLKKAAHGLSVLKMRGPKSGEDTKSFNARLREANALFHAYAESELGASGRLISGFIDALPRYDQKDALKQGIGQVRGKTSPIEAIKSQLKSGRWQDVVDVVTKHDEAYTRAVERGANVDPDEMRERRDLELRQLVNGNLGMVIEAVRKTQPPDLGKILGTGFKTLDPSDVSGNRDAVADWENSTREGPDDVVSGIQTGTEKDVGIAAPSEWERVPDQDVAVSGHSNPDFPGEYGEKGYKHRELNGEFEVHSARRPVGKKPSTQHGGHVDIDSEDVLVRAKQTAGETGRSYEDVLAEEAQKVITKTTSDAARWQADLEDRGVNVNDALHQLNALWDLSSLDRAEAWERGDPQEQFDARAALRKERISDADALAITSIYWANKKAEYMSEKGPEEFFKKFKHSYHITRNKGGGHEELGSHEINAALVKADKYVKMKGVSAKDGYLTATIKGDDTPQFFDVTKMMERAIGKVRDRTEGLNDEEGSWNNTEAFNRNLRNDDGSFNTDYLKALRSAWASTMISLLRSEQHTMSAETAAILANPPKDLLLVRGTDGKGDIRYRDIMQTGDKKASFDDPSTVLSGKASGDKVADLKNGLVSGYTDAAGKPVVIDMPALVRETAKQLGVDLTGNPSRDAIYHLAKVGIDALRADGHIDGSRLVNGKGKLAVLAKHFHNGASVGVKLFDRMAFDSEGKPVRDKSAVVSLSMADAERAYRTGAFSLDSFDQTLAKMAGLIGLIEGELLLRKGSDVQRTDAQDHPLVQKLDDLGQQLTQAYELIDAMQTDAGKRGAMNKAHAVLKQIQEIQEAVDRMAPETQTLKTTEPYTEPNRANINVARNDDRNDQIERDLNPQQRRLRDDLTAAHVDELRGKLENLYEAMQDLRGQGDEPFVADHGHMVDKFDRVETARTVGKEKASLELENQGKKQTHQVARTVKTNATTDNFVNREKATPRSKMRSGTLEDTLPSGVVDDFGNAGMTGAQNDAMLAARGTATNAAAERANKPATVVSRKADRQLQSAIEAWKEGKRAHFQDIPDEAVKAYYDAASKIDTPSAKKAAEKLRARAELDGIDLTNSSYTSGEFRESSKGYLLKGDEASDGMATAKLDGEKIRFMQDGKDVGFVNAITMPDLTAALKNGDPVDINLDDRTGTGRYGVDAVFLRADKKMPAYHGARDVVEAQKSQIPVPRQRVAQGSVNYKPQEVKLGPNVSGSLEANGKLAEVSFPARSDARTVYSREDAVATFGSEIVGALENIARAKAEGKEPSAIDLHTASHNAMVTALGKKPPTPPKGGGKPKSSGPKMSDANFKENGQKLIEKLGGGAKASLLFNGREATDTELDQVLREAAGIIDHLFKGKVDTNFADRLMVGGNVAGASFDPKQLSPAGRLMINLSVAAKSHILSNTFHEAIHALNTILSTTQSGKDVMAKLMLGINNERTFKSMERAFASITDKETVAKIMESVRADPEEAAAYAFQLHAMGMLKIGPEAKGVFGSIVQFFRRLFQITTTGERSEAFMDAFLKGELGRADFKESALSRAFGEKYGDHVLQNVSSSLEPIKHLLHTVFDSSVEAMDRLGSEHANALTKLYTGRGKGAGFIHNKAENQRLYASKAQQALFDKFSKAELEAGVSEYLGGSPKSEAAKAVKAFMATLNEYAGREADYKPTIWDTNKIASNRAKFDAALKDFGYTDKSGKVDHPAILNILKDMGYGDRYSDKDKFDFLPEYAEEKAKWLQSDPHEFLRQAINRTVNYTEAKKLNLNVERTRLLGELKKEKGEEAYWKAQKAVEGWEGRLGADMDPKLRAAANMAITVGNVVTLPFMIFSAAIDPFHVAARSGRLSEAFNAYMHGLASIPKSITEMFGVKHSADALQKFAEDAGAIEHAMLTDSLSDIYMGDNAQGLLKRVNDWYFRANLADGWTRKMRIAAVEAADRFLKAHANGNETQHSMHYLEELGLKPGDVKLRPDGRVDVNDEKIRSAVNQFVYESVVRPDASTNAIWMNDQRFALLAHMKKFTFAFQSQILDRTFTELGRGNAAPLLNLIPSIPIIIAADGIKHMIKGNYEMWMKGQDLMGWFGYGMERAGMAGKFQFGLDALYDLKHGATPVDSFLGPEYGLLKKAAGVQRMGGSTGDLGLLGLADDMYFAHRAFQVAQKAGKGLKGGKEEAKASVLGALGASNDSLRVPDSQTARAEALRAEYELGRGNDKVPPRPGQTRIATEKVAQATKRARGLWNQEQAANHERELRRGFAG